MLRANAARMYKVNEPLRLEEIDIAPPERDEVIVKVMAAGVCSSDVHFIHGRLPISKLPIVPGHECAGVVEALGEGVTSLSEGEHVVIDYVEACGECCFCREGRENLCDNSGLFGFATDGAFQQFVTVPARSLHRVPQHLPFDQCAILGCAVVTPYHAFRIAKVKRGDTVVLFGIGGVGTHAVMLSKLLGCRTIAVDVSENRLDPAREAGADLVINASSQDPIKAVLQATDNRGADHAFDLVGSSTATEQCLGVVRKGGKAVLVGLSPSTLELKPLDIILREVEIMTSIDHLGGELDEVIRLAASGKIDLSRSITHHVRLDQVNEGITILEQKIGNPTRVAVLPH